MTPEEELDGLKSGIELHLDHFDGVLPERYAIAWRAHLAGYAEWGAITPEGYREVLAMVPDVHNDPAERIARLNNGAPPRERLEPMSDELVSELTARIQYDIESFGGELPEREAIAWWSYLAALMLVHAISIPTLDDLDALLPYVPDNPVGWVYGGPTEWKPRLQNDINRFGGRLPERYAIAWRGYLAALWEWDRLNTRTYHEMLAMVPVRDDPSRDIVREQDHERWRQEGRRTTYEEVASELRARLQHDIDRFGGVLPERFAIAWDAYLAAVMFEDVIADEAYDELIHLVPPVPGDPVAELFAERDD